MEIKDPKYTFMCVLLHFIYLHLYISITIHIFKGNFLKISSYIFRRVLQRGLFRFYSNILFPKTWFIYFILLLLLLFLIIIILAADGFFICFNFIFGVIKMILI